MSIAADRVRDASEGRFEGYTTGLAALDAVPVILFMLSGCVLFVITGSPVVLTGAAACFLGGTAKVIWKFIAVLRGKDVKWMSQAFRVLMIGGFALIAAGLVIRAARSSGDPAAPSIHWTAPAVTFLILGFAGMCLMGYLGSHMKQDARANWTEELVNTAAQAAILAGLVFLYLGMYYPAGDTAAAAVHDTDRVDVTETEEYYFFDGPGTDTAVIFYPGAQVEAAAYAPLMGDIAGRGFDCCICKVPCSLAFFGKGMAGDIRTQNEYSSYYLAGHSLGGVVAGMLAAEEPEQYDGLIMLASYPDNEVDIRMLSVYGSQDGVLNMEKYNDAADQGCWPDDSEEVVIQGGNHAQFGDYGPQNGDGEPEITADEQQEITAEAICSWIIKQ